MNEDRSPKTPNQLNLTQRGKAVVAIGLLGAGAVLGIAGKNTVDNINDQNKLYSQTTDPKALENYQNGLIDPEKTIVVTATESGTAWEFAHELKKDGNVQALVNEVAAQVGSDGVQVGEQVVVPRGELDSRP